MNIEIASPDLSCPALPDEIFGLSTAAPDLTYHDRCEELWSEIVTEILDPDYLKRAHHNTGTYDIGCRGPLCRKAQREHPRRKSPVGNVIMLREERVYDPVIEYFHVVMKYRVRSAQQALLKELRDS